MRNWIAEQLANYMPHRMCFARDPELTWLAVLGNGEHFIAYMAISGALAFMVTRRWPREYADIRFCAAVLAAFVFTCGVTHLLNIVVLWHPIYKVQILWGNFSGMVSVMTMVLIAFFRSSIMSSARLGPSILTKGSKDYSGGLFDENGKQKHPL